MKNNTLDGALVDFDFFPHFGDHIAKIGVVSEACDILFLEIIL